MTKLTEKQEKKNGRPSEYTQDKADLICARMSEGKSLRSICLDDLMPSTNTVFRWLRENKEFRDQYAIACDERHDCMAESTLTIADDTRLAESAVEVSSAKLRIEARQWFLSKMSAKKFGSNAKVLLGNDPENPITALIAQISGSTLKPNDTE